MKFPAVPVPAVDARRGPWNCRTSSSLSGSGKDKVYEFLFEKLKGQFVDFQPGPDLTKYAEAVAAGEVE